MFSIHQATVSDIPEMTELYKNTVLTVNRKDYSAEDVEDGAYLFVYHTHLINKNSMNSFCY